MDSVRQEFLLAIHTSGRQAAIVVTGGGSLAISDLLSVPGASAFVLEARVPYAPAALTEWLGREPEQCCSRETALAMAVVAFQRARSFSSTPESTIGVSGTASLASNRPKRGEHRAWIATHTANATRLIGFTFAKGLRDRAGEERLLADLLLRLIAETCGITSFPDVVLQAGDSRTSESAIADSMLVDLIAGRRDALWSLPIDAPRSRQLVWQAEPVSRPAGLLAGSFNPLHDGHRELARVAERRLGGPVAFELACFNVDKPPLDFLTIETRCQQFTDRPVVLTHAPTFLLKSRLFPNTTFVVGIDTAERIVQSKYYGGVSELLAALSEIRSHGCRFLVAGRLEGASFHTLSEMELPPSFQDLFEEIPEMDFRRDLSSTDTRVILSGMAQA